MIIRKQEAEIIDFSGLEILDYTSRVNEKSSFAVLRVLPGVSHKLSWSNRSDKYYYVIHGTIEFTLKDEIHILKDGDFCLIKKGEQFRYVNNTNEIVSLILVHTPNFILEKEVYI